MKMNSFFVLGSVVAGIFFLSFLLYNTATSGAATKNVSAEEAAHLLDANRANKDFIVIDIRTPGEFSQGHIKGALNIDYFSPDFKKMISRLDRDKSYLVHCKSGGRSGKSIAIFEGLNFKNILHLNSGFDGWMRSGLPVER